MGIGCYRASEEKIRQDYCEWLADIVGANTGSPGSSYRILMMDLFKVKFVPLVEHDDNRAADGIALRERYLGDAMWSNGEEALCGDCTLLEMMIALAERMAFELSPANEEDPEGLSRCFWEMVNNLGLMCYTDRRYDELDGMYHTYEIAQKFVCRQIAPNGFGGIFPLRNATADQRGVELWFQMHAYLKERYSL